MSQISWDDQDGNDVTNYKVQYKDEAAEVTWSNVNVKSSGEARQIITLKELEQARECLIQICAERKIIVSDYNEVFSANTKSASPPGKPELKEAASDSLTIVFKETQSLGKDVQIIKVKSSKSSRAKMTGQLER